LSNFLRPPAPVVPFEALHQPMGLLSTCTLLRAIATPQTSASVHGSPWHATIVPSAASPTFGFAQSAAVPTLPCCHLCSLHAHVHALSNTHSCTHTYSWASPSSRAQSRCTTTLCSRIHTEWTLC